MNLGMNARAVYGEKLVAFPRAGSKRRKWTINRYPEVSSCVEYFDGTEKQVRERLATLEKPTSHNP